MKVFSDYFKAFKTHRIILEFTRQEVEEAKLTVDERKLLKTSTDNWEKALIIKRGIERRILANKVS